MEYLFYNKLKYVYESLLYAKLGQDNRLYVRAWTIVESTDHGHSNQVNKTYERRCVQYINSLNS